MSNQLTTGDRPNKKNIELLDLTQKVILLSLWRGKKHFFSFDINIKVWDKYYLVSQSI